MNEEMFTKAMNGEPMDALEVEAAHELFTEQQNEIREINSRLVLLQTVNFVLLFSVAVLTLLVIWIGVTV